MGAGDGATRDARDEVAQASERWFLRRGLPHFIADYDATHDIWTRSLPVLTLLLLVEIAATAPNHEYPAWLSLLAVAVAFGVLLGGWAASNRMRGRRALSRPDDLGPLEIGAFVVVPSLVALVAGFQVGTASALIVANVVLLSGIYFFTSYALFPTIRWALGRIGQQLGSLAGLLARALPLIALLVTFLFLTQEVWETAGDIHGLTYWIVLALFPIVGVSFLVSRLPRELQPLQRFDDVDDARDLVAGTPAADAVDGVDLAGAPPLDRREWRNVAVVWLFSEGVQIFLVSVVIGVFFVLLGILLVDARATQSWSGQVNVFLTINFDNRKLVITEELLRVAGFLTAFSGLNFTVFLLTDQTYRTEFGQDIVRQLRQSLAVRAVYRVQCRPQKPSSTMSPT